MGYDEKRQEAEDGTHFKKSPHKFEQYGHKYLGPKVVKGLKSRKCKFALLGIIAIPIIIILILITVVFVRANNVGTQAGLIDSLNRAKTEGIDDGKEMERARRLAGALKIPTISFEVGKQNIPAMLPFHNYLKESFPLIHTSNFITLEKINNYSLLYTVIGTRPGKLPYMLCSHFDVVPANPATWTVNPFGGVIVNNTYIYGRGAIDDKGGVMGILEAVEYMLSKNMRPQRSFFMAFGHDEEIGGTNGAEFIASTLKQKGVTKLDFILDEGFTVTRDILPGTTSPIALIGIAEKGVLTINLTVNGNPGHSSMPPWNSPIGILSKAMARLEEYKLPSLLGQGAETLMFESVAAYCDLNYRIMYSNIWLFKPRLTEILEKLRITNGMVRTTTALTIVKGGDKENVVPGTASGVVQHRIHPSQSVQDVFDFDKKTINDDRVTMTISRGREPPPTSPAGPSDLGYQLVVRSITQTFDGVGIAPGVMIGNTDTLRYGSFSDNIYRFQPYLLEFSDTARIHGIDERVSVTGYKNAVSFYYRFIQNADVVYDIAPNL